ncbi:MAG: T9SS type A sorting domain-containing protein, partial [Endomicrobia bacterium]|nr:T9SS type A sorting domain-containing protein [Endomicrobiia bacterium]
DILVVKHILSSDVAVEYIIEPKLQNLSSCVRIKLLYFDLNDDGKEDILGIEEKELVIYYYDEFKNKYVYIGGTVDTKQNTISADVYNLGRFLIASKNTVSVISNLENNLISKYFITPANPLIKFSTDVEEISVYTINGKEVFRKRISNNNGNIVWFGKDDLGNFVESGVYICKIKDKSNKITYRYIIVSK